jgi:hypothetical protein
MSDNPQPDNGQDLVPRDALAAPRDDHGRLLPGARLNPAGRPNGRPNDTTLAARDLAKASASRALETVVEDLSSRVPFVRQSAAFKILALVYPKGLPEQSTPNVNLVRHLTLKERLLVDAIFKRAMRRANLSPETRAAMMEEVDVQDAYVEEAEEANVIDVTPQPPVAVDKVPWSDPPAPAPEDDDMEEFE